MARASERFVKGRYSPGHGLGLAFVRGGVTSTGGTIRISGRSKRRSHCDRLVARNFAPRRADNKPSIIHPCNAAKHHIATLLSAVMTIRGQETNEQFVILETPRSHYSLTNYRIEVTVSKNSCLESNSIETCKITRRTLNEFIPGQGSAWCGRINSIFRYLYTIARASWRSDSVWHYQRPHRGNRRKRQSFG